MVPKNHAIEYMIFLLPPSLPPLFFFNQPCDLFLAQVFGRRFSSFTEASWRGHHWVACRIWLPTCQRVCASESHDWMIITECVHVCDCNPTWQKSWVVCTFQLFLWLFILGLLIIKCIFASLIYSSNFHIPNTILTCSFRVWVPSCLSCLSWRSCTLQGL